MDRFSFAEPFTVFVDDMEIKTVSSLQLIRDCSRNTDSEGNKATIIYQVNGQERVLTVGLEAISFDRV